MAFAVTLSSPTSINTNPVASPSPDVDIAMFVGTKLITLSKNTHSSPEGYGCSGDGEETNHDKWKLDLMRHGQALVNYAMFYNTDEGQADAWEQSAQEHLDEVLEMEVGYVNFVVPAQEAMQWVASNFADLWS